MAVVFELEMLSKEALEVEGEEKRTTTLQKMS